MATGSVIPKGPRQWLLRWFVGRDGRGKRHYGSQMFEGTAKQAQQKVEELAGAARGQKHLRPNRQTVEDFYPDWLASKKKLSAYTRSQYEARYTQDVLPFFGKTLLKDVTPQLVARWVEWMQAERKLSARTIQYSTGVFKQIMTLAFRWQLIPSVPTDGVELPAQRHEEGAQQAPEVLTPEQMRQLLDHSRDTADPLFPLWSVLLNGGLRPQEAQALEVADLVGNRLTIRQAVKDDGNGGLVIGPTKTAKSRRTVQLPQEAAEALRAHLRARQYIGGLIFRNTAGGLTDLSKLRKLWRKACRSAGVPELNIYAARHSHATALLAAGVPLKVVSERLGHASVKITGDIYSHVLPEMDDRAAQAMEALLAAKPYTAAAAASGASRQ
jgi:integrase